MLQQSFLENAVSILTPHLLMLFELLIKLCDILQPNDIAHEYLVHDIIVGIHKFASLVFVKSTHQHVFVVTSWRQYCASDCLLQEELLTLSIDIGVV